MSEKNEQQIPQRGVKPQNNSVSHKNDVHKNERVQFENNHVELPGCVPGQICQPIDGFDTIQKCANCPKTM